MFQNKVNLLIRPKRNFSTKQQNNYGSDVSDLVDLSNLAMDATQQLKKLTNELQQATDERDCIKEKYEDLLEAHKNLLKQCRCHSEGNFRAYNWKQDNAERNNSEIERELKRLENKISLLEIQLSTYKEDFQMERKDREAAQDRVIRLEQELTDLCSGGCHVRSLRGFIDSEGFEVLPSALHCHYPQASIVPSDIEKQPCGSNVANETKLSCHGKNNGLKNIMSHIFIKKMPQPSTEVQETSKTREVSPKHDVMYEYDGINKPDAELRGRMFRDVIPKTPEQEDPRLASYSFPLDSKRKIDLAISQAPSIVKVLPQSCTTSNPSEKDFVLKSRMKESSRGLNSDEILRCPACFRGFKASTEHYKLLQHMDSCC